MQPDTSNKFQAYTLNEQEQELALQVSPYFLAYLQNKIAAYAGAVVDAELPYDPDPKNQIKAILAHEKFKNYVQAYEELLAELLQSQLSSNSKE